MNDPMRYALFENSKEDFQARGPFYVRLLELLSYPHGRQTYLPPDRSKTSPTKLR